MEREFIKMVKMAQKLYILSVKYEKRIPKSVFLSSMEIYNRYIKMAKKNNLRLSEEELYDNILK